MSYVYFVESPLQLLSAISAKEHFSNKTNYLIINDSSSSRINHNKQMSDLLKENEWNRVFRVKYCDSSLIRNMRLIKIIFSLNISTFFSVRRFFIGEYRNINMRFVGAFLNSKEYILLDDGAFTITAQCGYICNDKDLYSLASTMESIKLSFLDLFFQSASRSFSMPNYYSFFDLDSVLLPHQQNYYTTFERKKEVVIEKGSVYFFGSKFSEAGFLNLEDELYLLNELKNKFLHKSIYYIAHRDETVIKLKKIKNIGFIIKDLGGPAENYFDGTLIMPEIVAAFYSTTLYTCLMRFSNVCVEAFDIRPYLIPVDVKYNAECIYEYYSALGIKVTSLKIITNNER